MADLIDPTVTLGLVDPTNMGSLLPLPDDGTVTPDARGLVRFRARIEDAGSGVRNVRMTVNSSSASMFGSMTHLTFIGAAVDCRNRKDGDKIHCAISAWDFDGNSTELVYEFILKK